MFLKLVTGSVIFRFIGAGAQLLLTLVVSTIYSPAEAGLFFFGFSILTILSAVSRLGSEMSALRTIAVGFVDRSAESVKSAVDARVLVITAVSLLFSVGLVVSSPWVAAATFGLHAAQTLVIVAVSLPAMTAIGLLSEVLRGAGRQWLAIIVQNVSVPGLAVAGMLAGRIFALGSLGAMECFSLSVWVSVAAAWACWLAVHRKAFGGSYGFLRCSRKDILSVLKDAPHLVFVSSASILMQWAGSVMLGFFATAEDVAGYSVAMRLSVAVSIVHSAAVGVVGPQMSVAHSEKKLCLLASICHSTSLLLIALTWPVLFGLLVFTPDIMGLFGPEYVVYSGILRILLAGQVLAAVLAHSGIVLVMTGHYVSARANSIMATLVFVFYSLTCILLWGIQGAALAYVLSALTGHLLAVLLVRRHVGIWTVPTGTGDLRCAITHLRRSS